MHRILQVLIPGKDDAELDFRLRSQLPYVALTTLSLFCTYLLILPLSYLKFGIDSFFFTVIGLSLVQFAALLLLRSGRFRGAAYLTTLSLIGASFAVLFLMQYVGNNVEEVFRAFSFAAVMAVVNVAVSLGPRQIWLYYALYSAGWIAAAATIFRHYAATNAKGLFVAVVVGLFALLCEAVLLFLVKQLSERMLTTAEAQTAKANASVAKLTRILADAKEGMDIGGRIVAATENAQKAAADVSDIQEFLRQESARLVSEAEVLIASSRRVLSGAQSMESSLISQNAAITETSAALVQMSQNVKSIAAVAKQRRSMLDAAAKAGRDQTERIRKLDGAFGSVQESSEGINRFIATVQDVASRTSLLSMNASIQAARAGNAGKGFAVVAQEIRALSTETQGSADVIKEMIQKNHETVGETGALISEFARFIAENAESTKILTDSMDEILNGVAEMDSGTAEIMSAIDQLVSGTRASDEMVKDVVSQIDTQQTGFAHLTSFAKDLENRIQGLKDALESIRSATDLVSEAGKLNIEQVRKLQIGD